MNEINIKQLRIERGLSQRQLAEICDVSIRTVQNWEAGANEMPATAYAKLCAISPKNISERKVYGGQHVLGGDAINGDKIVEKITEREIEIDKAEFECDPLVTALQSTIADQKDRITFLENQLAESQTQLADANKRIQILTDKLLNI